MRMIGQGWSSWMLLSAILMASVSGCSKSTESAPAAAAPTTPQTAPVGDRYARQVDAPTEPALAHVALPEVKQQPTPFVVIKTTEGSFKLRLDTEHAPRTVYNFVAYVNSGHYTNTIFHQVERGYAILGGGFTEDMQEKPSRYAIPNEATNGLKNRRGTIAMARRIDDPHSATCQFIINLVDNPSLDHQGPEPEKYGFCVFGEVVEGFETLDKIAAAEVRDVEGFVKLPVKPIKITGIHTLR
ncbi:MAG: peptidylprolyl isomerase [Planctomycetaceae bacterium]|nr:peptidylprolyl isomerase [Planctomycetaceae bacterium]